VSKKKSERLRREIAERKAKDREESEKRQERIKVLWREITSGELARDAKDLADNELVRSLVELAQLQKLQIGYLAKFRRDWEQILAYYPEQLKNLYSASLMKAVQPLIKKQTAVEDPKKRGERKRRRYDWGGIGLIEREFGGDGEAWWRKSTLSGLLDDAYKPVCLDEIFRGGRVPMRRLQELIGMDRRRFSEGLLDFSFKKGRERHYDWQALVKIMDDLLGEGPRERKRRVRGGSMRKLWLSDPDVSARVLRGIESRANDVSPCSEIRDAFKAIRLKHVH
jgi:hypothetical protein